jgi:hypothetical protein
MIADQAMPAVISAAGTSSAMAGPVSPPDPPPRPASHRLALSAVGREPVDDEDVDGEDCQ